ncbi:MAG: hypothetical protein H0U23_17315 [Blastocatellia bacterium]|nr:hypothetical protein [Blastocatellia bacterium]
MLWTNPQSDFKACSFLRLLGRDGEADAALFPLSLVDASGTAGSRQEIWPDHAVIQAWLKNLGEETGLAAFKFKPAVLFDDRIIAVQK